MTDIVQLHSMMGIAFGATGGMIAALLAIFNNFKTPNKPISQSKTAIKNRVVFFVARIVVGGLFGFLVSFWFSPDVTSGNLALEKLAFIQGIVGLAASFIPKLPFGIEN